MQSDEELSARLLLLENQVSEVRTEVRRKHRTRPRRCSAPCYS